MADDNVSISIGVNIGKLRTDLELLKNEYRKGDAEFKKFVKQFAATGDKADKSKAEELATSQAALNKQISLTNVEVRKLQASYVGLRSAHEGLRESHSKGVREAISLSREFSNASVSAFSLAKAFREIPVIGSTVAVGVAAVAAAGIAIVKTADDAAKAVKELDDLSKAIGRPQKEIVGLEKIFRDAAVDPRNVNPLLRGLSEQFNKARFAGGGLQSALTGGLVAPRPTTPRAQIAGTIAADQAKRRAAGLPVAGVYDDQGRRVSLPEDELPEPFPGIRTPAFDKQGRVVGRFVGGGAALFAPQPGAFARDIARTGSGFEGEGAATVFRGGEPIQFDPSKGLFGLIDPAAFPNLEKAIEAATLRLNQIAQINPDLAIEIARGTPGGMKPEETLKALQGVAPGVLGPRVMNPFLPRQETPMERAIRETAEDPRLRAEAQPRTEEYFKELFATRKTLEDFEIGKGIQLLPGATMGLKGVGGLTREIEKGPGSWLEQALQPEMGPPLLPGGQSPEGALGAAILDAIKKLFQGPSPPGELQKSPLFPTIPGPFQQPTTEQPPIRLDERQPLAPSDFFDKSRTAPEPREKFGALDELLPTPPSGGGAAVEALHANTEATTQLTQAIQVRAQTAGAGGVDQLLRYPGKGYDAYPLAKAQELIGPLPSPEEAYAPDLSSPDVLGQALKNTMAPMLVTPPGRTDLPGEIPVSGFATERGRPFKESGFGTPGLDQVLQENTTATSEETQASDRNTTALGSLQEALAAAVQSISNAGSSSPSSQFAIGGLVSGLGSGDTVPAWLTPGEYVARRGSVDYYGRALFAALNNRMLPRDLFSRVGYATGGLVGGGIGELGSAEGAGRAPVHLHLDGHQFALHGTSGVVDALVAEAGRYQMRSGGLKPSWYGGRPNG